MHILIVDPQQDGPLDIEQAIAGPGVTFHAETPVGDAPLAEATYAAADAVINFRSRHRLPAERIAWLRRCRVIVQAGVGFNHIDLAACGRRGLPVCNTPDYGTNEVSDHAAALILALSRGIAGFDAGLRRGPENWEARRLSTPRRLRGARLGMLGLGRIGLATARRMEPFGLQIAFYDPYLPAGFELALGYERAPTLEALLARTDILSIHAPLTPETDRVIDAAALAQMPEGAVVVNTARGPLIDLDAVEGALRSGRLAAAGLDVLPQEPPDYRHPLLAAWAAGESWLEGRLIVTPHAAFYSPASLLDMRRLAMQTAIDYLRHGRLRTCVNAAELAAR